MKVVALYQFYIDFVFPRRLGADGSYGLRCQFPEGVEAMIRPRNSDEVLFPNDVDGTLSTMHVALQRLTSPTGQLQRAVRDVCFDRLEVIVRREVYVIEDARSAQLQDSYKNFAVRVCNLFLDHCRVVARSHVVVPLERHYRPQDGRYYLLCPHSIAWFDGESNENLPVYEGGVSATCSSGAIQSPEAGVIDPLALQQSFLGGAQPDLVWSLLIDARERVVTLRLREAVLSMAVACEVASNHQIAMLGSGTRAIKEILKNKQLSFAERPLVRIPMVLGRSSFKDEHPDEFADIANLYKCRNSIAHVGKAQFTGDGGSIVEVDPPLALRFLTSAERACEWLAVSS